MLDQNKMC